MQNTYLKSLVGNLYIVNASSLTPSRVMVPTGILRWLLNKKDVSGSQHKLFYS